MLAGVGIGLAISALSATMQQAMFFAFVLLLPMMLLSGLATPVANMAPALQLATWLNPLRFGIDFVRRVYLEGVGLDVLWPDLVPMLAMAAATLPLAALGCLGLLLWDWSRGVPAAVTIRSATSPASLASSGMKVATSTSGAPNDARIPSRNAGANFVPLSPKRRFFTRRVTFCPGASRLLTSLPALSMAV